MQKMIYNNLEPRSDCALESQTLPLEPTIARLFAFIKPQGQR
jgi:hypothetical protein